MYLCGPFQLQTRSPTPGGALRGGSYRTNSLHSTTMMVSVGWLQSTLRCGMQHASSLAAAFEASYYPHMRAYMEHWITLANGNNGVLPVFHWGDWCVNF